MKYLLKAGLFCSLFSPPTFATDAFSSPRSLCQSLANNGIPTAGWKKSRAFEGEWICLSTLIPFGRTGPYGMENNIALYVTGTTPGRANEIRIKVNVNNPRQVDQAFNRLSRATDRIFSTMGADTPDRLVIALKEKSPVEFDTDYGRVSLIKQPGRIDSYVVSITDAVFLSAQEQKREAASSDFDTCKTVVSKTIKYAESFLSGDGDPIVEKGYKSFMIKGKGRDLFFCEVFPSGDYRIKASLNGKYPFKYMKIPE